MHKAESKKYKVRLLVDEDFNDVKKLIMNNKYLGILWSTSTLPEERLDELIWTIYIKHESYCVIDKQTEEFCGFISMSSENNEGELSVRMVDNVDMGEVMELFGEMLKKVAPSGKETNFTMQYCFE